MLSLSPIPTMAAAAEADPAIDPSSSSLSLSLSPLGPTPEAGSVVLPSAALVKAPYPYSYRNPREVFSGVVVVAFIEFPHLLLYLSKMAFPSWRRDRMHWDHTMRWSHLVRQVRYDRHCCTLFNSSSLNLGRPHVPTMENERTAAEEEEKRREEGPTTPDLALPDTQFSSGLI